MPGLYINDGGATSSAIGNILGGIAQEVGPEGAAKAALLSQQTQGADLDNQAKWNALVAGQNLDIPGLTRTLNMNATDPTNPSVAGTVTSLAVPPTVRGPGGRLATIPDESGYTPEQKYLLNEAINGRLGSDALGKDVDTFSTPLVGAGGTPGAIRTRATTPLGPGQQFDVTGQPGGPTMGGGSTYAHAGDEASGTADIALANTDLETGNAAAANLGKIDPILDLYKTVIAPEATVGGKLSQTVKEKLAAQFNVPLERFDDPAAAKALIRTQLLSFVGGLRDSAGNPLPRGAIDLITNQIPDPSVDPNGFLASMNWVRAHLQTQVSNAAAAQHFIETRASDPGAGPAYHAQRGTNAGEEGKAYQASGLKGAQGEGGSGGGGQVYVFPDEASMEAAGAAGNLPDGARVQLGYGPKGVSGTYHKGAK